MLGKIYVLVKYLFRDQIYTLLIGTFLIVYSDTINILAPGITLISFNITRDSTIISYRGFPGSFVKLIAGILETINLHKLDDTIVHV